MTASFSSSLPCCSRLLFLVIFLTAATSPSSGWLQIIPPINYYSNIIHPPSRPSFHSLSRLPRRSSSQLQSSRDDNEERSTANIQTTGSGGGGSDQLQLRIGKRVGSGAYGTVHIATHLNNSDNETRYIAKRAWTLSELELNVPMAVMQLDTNNSQRTGVVCATGLAEQDNNDDDDGSDTTDNSNNEDKLKETAARCQYYWNVERHIVQKLASASSIEEGGDAINDSYVTPQFKGVYQSAPINDNIDNDGGEQEKIVPGYGTINKLDRDSVDDNNNNQGMGAFFSMFNNGDDDNKEGLCHEWMVFEYIPSPLLSDEESLLPAMTLLDAMGVSTYFLHQYILCNISFSHTPHANTICITCSSNQHR